MQPTRREFLGLTAAVALGVGACRDGGESEDVGPVTTPSTEPPTSTEAPVGPNPFTLGVASGDPDATSVVLWTHVDRPGDAPVELAVELSRDRSFGDIDVTGTATADPAAAMTARLVVRDLDPDSVYWYRFVLDGHRTPPARTRTAPAEGDVPAEPLRLGHLSCMRYSSGYWTALDDVAATAPDLVVHCGDYIYESDRGDVRPVDEPAATTLDGYRAVWRRYRSDPSLQAAHAVAPWLIVWDDHEVEDNYHGVAAGDRPADQELLDRRTAAYRAWWEFTPTRLAPPEGPALRIHRTVDWGGLARFVLLDTRQYRDDQPCGDDLGPRCDETASVTMLGAEQEAWVAEEAVRHQATWTSVVQQVVLHQWKFLPGNRLWNLDQWDGYTGARAQLLDVLGRASNPVVLTGDVHSSWVSDLRTDFDDDGSDAVGVEFVAPGVSSKVPTQLRAAGSFVELASPHIAWSETSRRGWVLHTVSLEEWTAEYRLVEDAERPGTEIVSESTWTVGAGERRLS